MPKKIETRKIETRWILALLSLISTEQEFHHLKVSLIAIEQLNKLANCLEMVCNSETIFWILVTFEHMTRIGNALVL